MNKDIRLSVGFIDHPKTIKLERRLGYEGVKCLLRLWAFAAEHKPEGYLTNMDAEDVELAAKWQGETGKFFETITDAKCRWLDIMEGDVYYLHDWHDHQGYVVHAPDRTAKAKKAADARWNATSTNKSCSEHATSMQGAMPECRGSNAPDPVPSPSPEPTPDLSSSSTEVEITDSEPPAGGDKMTMREFQTSYHKTIGVLMSGMLNEEARLICDRYPRDKLVQTFIRVAEKGGRSFDYFKKVLEGKPKASEASRASPQTFAEIRDERSKQACREFAEG